MAQQGQLLWFSIPVFLGWNWAGKLFFTLLASSNCFVMAAYSLNYIKNSFLTLRQLLMSVLGLREELVASWDNQPCSYLSSWFSLPILFSSFIVYRFGEQEKVLWGETDLFKSLCLSASTVILVIVTKLLNFFTLFVSSVKGGNNTNS